MERSSSTLILTNVERKFSPSVGLEKNKKKIIIINAVPSPMPVMCEDSMGNILECHGGGDRISVCVLQTLPY